MPGASADSPSSVRLQRPVSSSRCASGFCCVRAGQHERSCVLVLGRALAAPALPCWPLAPHLRGLRDPTEVAASCCCVAGSRPLEPQLRPNPFSRACLAPTGCFHHQEHGYSPDAVYFLPWDLTASRCQKSLVVTAFLLALDNIVM